MHTSQRWTCRFILKKNSPKNRRLALAVKSTQKNENGQGVFHISFAGMFQSDLD
jgi:hypothetical protein